MDSQAPSVVFTTTNPAEAQVIKVALEAEGIQSMATGTEQAGFIGIIPEVTVVVPAADAERAREIITTHSTREQ